MNGGLPKGERWHIELLEGMVKSLKTRPQVISADLKERLKEYLGFRYLFRNTYLELKWHKLSDLLIQLRDLIWKKFCREMGLFDGFLQEVLKEIEEGG